LPGRQISHLPIQPLREKYPLLRRPKSTLELPPSRPTQRGVSRSSRTLERDAVDAAASGAHRQSQGGSNGARERSSGTQTNGAVFAFTEALADWSVEAFGADGSRTAKPCGPGPLLVSSRRRLTEPDWAPQNLNPPTTATRRIRSPGRAAQGRPGVSGEPVVITLACFVLFRTRGRGCSGHPAFPAPSVIGGTRLLKPRAHRAARTRIRVLTLSTTLVRASPPWLRTARWPWGTRTCARRRVSGVAEGGP